MSKEQKKQAKEAKRQKKLLEASADACFRSKSNNNDTWKVTTR